MSVQPQGSFEPIQQNLSLQPQGIGKTRRRPEPLPLTGESGLKVLNTQASKGSVGTYAAVTLIILAVIGGLVAMGLTGQFTSDGWLCKVAFPAIKQGFEDFGHWVTHTAIPAIRKFLDMKANLTVGQGLLYIALPIAGTALLAGLGYKYGPNAVEWLKGKRAEHKTNQEASARAREEIDAAHAKVIEARNERVKREQDVVDAQAKRIADRRKEQGKTRPLLPDPQSLSNKVNAMLGDDLVNLG